MSHRPAGRQAIGAGQIGIGALAKKQQQAPAGDAGEKVLAAITGIGAKAILGEAEIALPAFRRRDVGLVDALQPRLEQKPYPGVRNRPINPLTLSAISRQRASQARLKR